MLPGPGLDRVPKSGTSVAYTTTRAPGEIFIQLAVRAGRDTRLKLASKGLLFELLTYHDGELPSDEDIYAGHRAAREAEGLKPDGIELIRGALDDLDHFGYLVRKTIRDINGQCRSVRAVTDSPGHHKLNLLEIFQKADQIMNKRDRLTALRELLVQREFPRGAHCPPADSRGAASDQRVVSLAAVRAARAERKAV